MRSLAVGVLVPVGSRDEAPHEHGLAHFIEHMAFKGTRRHSASQLLRRIEGAGAELNAFTSRDHMFFYVHGIDRHGPRAVETLYEMLAEPAFPPAEIEKERNVIVEEIEMYKDSPDDDIADRFFERLFAGHPLGRDILGTPDRVRTYTQSDLIPFHRRFFHPARWIWSAAGGVSPSRLLRWFGRLPLGEGAAPSLSPRFPPPIGRTFDEERRTSFHQAHGIVGFSLPALPFEGRIRLSAIAQYLGGSMRSVLWQELRERRGDVYHIAAHTQFFEDASVFYIHFATSERRLAHVLQRVRKVLQKVWDRPLGRLRLYETRHQMLTSALWADENVAARISSQAWQWMHYGHVVEPTFREKIIRSLTPSSLWEWLQDHLHTSNPATLVYHSE